MHSLLRKALLRIALLYAYVPFFAWIFTLIERKDETAQDRMKKMITELRREINIKCNMTDDDFESFVRRAAAAVSTGSELDWTFWNSGEFVHAALTTIGYGHITPQTPLGQGITIIMCIIGIPITVLALKATGELLATCIRYLVVKTETVLLKRVEPKHVKMKTSLVACTLTAVLLIVVSVSAVYLENWTFIEGLYAWFTTFTTIGFGDYVPFESLIRNVDQGKISESKLIAESFGFSVPYFVGLSLTACILNCIVDSLDEIRDFRDRYLNCWPRFTLFIGRLFCRKNSCGDVSEQGNQVHSETSHEMRQMHAAVNTTL